MSCCLFCFGKDADCLLDGSLEGLQLDFMLLEGPERCIAMRRTSAELLPVAHPPTLDILLVLTQLPAVNSTLQLGAYQ